jgi:hypothetical protein
VLGLACGATATAGVEDVVAGGDGFGGGATTGGVGELPVVGDATDPLVAGFGGTTPWMAARWRLPIV